MCVCYKLEGKAEDLNILRLINIEDYGMVQPVRIMNKRLVWSIMVVYPELKLSLCIPNFHEDST